MLCLEGRDREGSSASAVGTGLASTVGPLVSIILAFAWNTAGSRSAEMPQPDPGLAPTVGTAVDQAADQVWASVTPMSTRIPARRVSPCLDLVVGQNGITNGPLSAPSLAHAAPATIYQGSGRERGQCVFAVGPPNQYPDLYVDGLAQNYWVDMEVTPTTGTPVNPLPVNSGAF
jgi:hypothetical protein